jgi:hypothetical protein
MFKVGKFNSLTRGHGLAVRKPSSISDGPIEVFCAESFECSAKNCGGYKQHQWIEAQEHGILPVEQLRNVLRVE